MKIRFRGLKTKNPKQILGIWVFAAMALSGCATGNVASKLSMVAFDEKINPDELKPVGQIEGKNCTWYVLGYGIGEDPTVRGAFLNAINQKEQSLIPGQVATKKGAPLKVVKNISVENGGFHAWVTSRSCIIVTGVGFQ